MSLDFHRRSGLILGIACMLCLPLAAHAAWPDDQPIHLVVPQAAGGTNDTVARIVGAELAKALGQSVVVENKAGASGAIGTQEVTRAKPDGYTLVMASDSTALMDVIRPKFSWKFARDLRAVAMVGDQPIALAVSARSPYRSFNDLMAAARQAPGTIAYGTSGVGTSQHVVGEWIAKLAKVDMVHVPYKGGGQAISDLVGGQVPAAVLGLAPMLSHQKSGGVRIVAITSGERNAAIPDVPTLQELGLPQIQLAQWVGIVAPVQVPDAVVARLSNEITRIVALPDVSKRLVAAGIDPRPMGHVAFDAHLKSFIGQWQQVVPTLNLQLP